ncbi:MAG: hypothetical protein HYZ37_10430 [Candidatus Solibacter usitatus]|nr:hypothetical protein [Candidatus Solibacter usitatus]
MNKPLIGVLIGAVLGFFDGLTAWLTPEARPFLQGILIGSSCKGLLVGLIAGFYARKVNSVKNIVILSSVVGLILAGIVAAMPSETGKHYYMEIMLPGFVLGGLTGFLTQRWGKA